MGKLTKEEFVVDAIKKLRDTNRSQGIHSVYSGFNAAFKSYFGEEARPTTNEMATAGKIVVQPRKGGVMIYLPGESPAMSDGSGEAALSKMGLAG